MLRIVGYSFAIFSILLCNNVIACFLYFPCALSKGPNTEPCGTP